MWGPREGAGSKVLSPTAAGRGKAWRETQVLVRLSQPPCMSDCVSHSVPSTSPQDDVTTEQEHGPHWEVRVAQPPKGPGPGVAELRIHWSHCPLTGTCHKATGPEGMAKEEPFLTLRGHGVWRVLLFQGPPCEGSGWHLSEIEASQRELLNPLN